MARLPFSCFAGAVLLALFVGTAAGQPLITTLTPNSTTAGGPEFQLTVNGSGFANDAVVNFGATALTPTFRSSIELRVQVGAALIAAPGAVNVTVTNPPAAVSNVVPFTINPSLSVTGPSLLPAGVVGAAYTPTTVTATGGTGAYTWSATGLPPGLSIAPATGIISGTPTSSVGSPFSVTVTVTDSVLATANRGYSLAINPALAITTPSPLPASTANVAYAAVTLAAAGGTPPYLNWQVTAGTFPPGLTLGAATGQISGTPTTAGPYNFTIQVTDSTTPTPLTATKVFDLTINLAPSITAPASLPSPWTQGVAYPNTTLTATGGTGAYTWSATGLPPGLSIAPTTGIISGTPTTSVGSPFSVMVTATDSVTATGNKLFSVTINPPLSITAPASLPAGAVGVAYPATQITATGGTGAYTWSATGLPPGLSIAPATGIISGTPTTSVGSPFSVTVTVTDSVTATANRGYALTINPALAITTPSPLPASTVNVVYAAVTLAVTGGTPPYVNWQVTAGTFPPGLTLGATTGQISGTPTAASAYNFTVQVTDSTTPAPLTATKVFDLTINPAPSITTASLPSPWTQGAAYPNTTLTATGGTGALTWSVSVGALPTGLALNPATGVLSGNPSAAATYNFTVRATDTLGAAGDKPFSVIINPPLSITAPTSLPTGAVGVAYPATQVTATGGTGAYTWSATGLPPGLSIAPATGIISGTPTSSVGSPFSVTVAVTDTVLATASRGYALTVNPALAITTPSPLPASTVNVAYAAAMLAATGGTPPYLNWQVTAGALPPGLLLGAATGQISGTPTAAGPYNFTIQVTDSTTPTPLIATKVFDLTINPALAITTATLPSPWTQGAVYPNTTMAATGGTGAYTWSAAGLPPGLSIAPATGIISGTPTTSVGSPFSVIVTVTDSVAATGNKPFSVIINPPLSITAPASLPAGAVGVAYPATQITATGGTGAYIWSATGLPAGLSIAPATGIISGTPTSSVGSPFSVTVTVTDSVTATANRGYALTINPALAITTPSPLPASTVNVAYLGVTLAATGGTPPYVNWQVTAGTFPPGLTLGAATGQISGTPTAAGPFNFTVQVTDGAAQTATKIFDLTINPAPSITTGSLPSPWAVNVAYPPTSLTATGGTGAFTWSLTPGSGPLPTGLGLSAAGVVSGTPTSTGTFNFTIRAADAAGAWGDKPFSVTITSALTIITPAVTSPWTVGIPYSQSLAASGGLPPYAWTQTGGALPAGLALAGNTISGTPTATGPFNFTIQVTDSTTPTPQTATKSFDLTINPAPTVTTASLPSPWTQGAAYPNTTLTATGGTGTLTWSVPVGTLPSGLALNPATGVLSGNPSAAATYNFTVRATDAVGATTDKPFSITINAALSITTVALPSPWTQGVAYPNTTLTTTGGTGTPAWSVPVGTLPTGLTLGPATGVLSGTPAAPGVYNFTVRATDTIGAVANRGFGVTINPPLTITTALLPSGTVGTAYATTLQASGGMAPYTWSATGLPSWLTLGASVGTLSGTPVSQGTYTFIIQVTDSATPTAQTVAKPLTITIAAGLVVVTSSLPGGTVGAAYSQTLAAAGGTPPYAWAVIGGSLPLGLNLGTTTGQIIGTPTSAGTSAFTVQVTDSTAATATRPLSVVVTAAMSITTGSLASGSVGVAYSQSLSVSGGASPYTWSVAGALPGGLTLNALTGVISGVPATAGTFSFTVAVQDSGGVIATKALSITVVSALTITSPAQLPGGAVGAAYSQTLTASGGSVPYTWSVVSGQLPAGLTLNGQTGALSGTPTAAGTSNFTIQVTDSAGQRTTQAASLTIASGFSITSESPLPAGSVGAAYSYTFSAAGGTPPYTDWKVTSGILPTGLLLNASGTLSGTPTAAGAFSFTIQVKDGAGATASKTFTLTIGTAALAVTAASPLPAGALGRPYSQTLTATGGVAPYVWAVKQGSLPAGLTIEPASGRISGTPTALGSSSFTVEVADSARRTAAKDFTLVIDPPPLPEVQITVAPGNPGPAQQPAVRLTLASGYPIALAGELNLGFEPDAVNRAIDPAVQFSSGGSTVGFTIAADATEAAFPGGSLGVQTGTVAGTITLRATFQAGGQSVTPSPAPSGVIRILQAAPVIRSVEVVRTGSGFDVIVKGFSTPRQVTQATFRFTAASGGNLQTSELTLPMTQLADQWFQGQESREFGGQFSLRQSFTVNGDVRAIASVSVVLSNGLGSSQAVSAAL